MGKSNNFDFRNLEKKLRQLKCKHVPHLGAGHSSIPPKYKDFRCSICDSKKYEQIIKSNGILGPGGRSWVDHNECAGCGVHFNDPEKFTKAKVSKRKVKK